MSNHSEKIDKLSEALAKAQSEMQNAVKDAENPFFRSKYADLASVWAACRPVLGKNGLCVMQFTEIVSERLMMVTMLSHASGQWIKSYLPLNPAKNDAQGFGSAISYMKRYGLSALIGVVADDVDTDDDGEAASGRRHNKHQQNQQKSAMTQKNVETEVTQLNVTLTHEHLNELINKRAQLDEETQKNFSKYLQEAFNTTNLDELPDIAFEKLNRNLSRKLEKDQNAAT